MALGSDEDLREMWEWAVQQHTDWKRRSRVSDLMVQGQWNVIWSDLSTEAFDPLVENLYIEALEDKAASAASITPFIEVAPTRGTRDDRAERDAQLRRRIFISLMRNSNMDERQQAFYFDWFGHGGAFVIPWVDWAASERHPFLVRMDPRWAYPIAFDSKEQLTQILFIKYRRTADLEHDPVAQYALPFLRSRVEAKGRKMPEAVQEIWFMDTDEWGLCYAVADDAYGNLFRYVSPTGRMGGGEIVWAVEPHAHNLKGCPAVAKVRRTPDGEIRGALDPMIPNLKVAQNVMARILEDIEQQVYAPKMIEGVVNPEDYGPGALLIGTGEGRMRIESAREPINYEAIQQVASQLGAARNVAAFPMQRSGEFGASIASAKATTAVMGSYSAQQGWAQRDIAMFYREALARLANFDEAWCGGRKQIDGWDEGEMFTDGYDPARFWKGDYRCEVGFHNIGLDEQNYLVRLGVAKQMGGLARRTFMRKSGLVDNPLAEEREIALEAVTDGFLAFMFQQANAGNADPLIKFADRIDGDQTTSRSAAMEVIKEMMQPTPTEGAGAGQPQGLDALLMQRSLQQGGIPGQAEGLPPVSGGLRAALPARVARGAAEAAPGASGP